MTDFFINSFNGSLITESILFAAFGFLLAAYILYTTQPPPPPTPIGQPPAAYPARAAIANVLVRTCKVTAGLITLNAVIAIYSLYRTNPTTLEQILLSIGFCITLIAMAVISILLARAM
jgi:hypothetical protein